MPHERKWIVIILERVWFINTWFGRFIYTLTKNLSLPCKHAACGNTICLNEIFLHIVGENQKGIIDLMHWRHKGSHLHNNDARSSVAQRARVVLAVRIGTQPLSARARAGQPGGVACRVCPPGCMLGDDARGSVSFDPQRSWAPFCDVICIWSIKGKCSWGLL